MLRPRPEVAIMGSSYGIGWARGPMGLYPVWTVDPSIERVAEIAHRHIGLSPDEIAQTTTKLWFQNDFNKMYAVKSPRGSFIMRVLMPIQPYYKCASEVATMAVIRSRTSIPVPEVIASSSTSENPLKFEWILMKRVAGFMLADIWQDLDWDAKLTCVKDVAMIVAQLFQQRYDSIGNLYHIKDLSKTSEPTSQDRISRPTSTPVVLGRIVSDVFFWNPRFKSIACPGPFASSKDWLNARIQLLAEHSANTLKFQNFHKDDIKEDMEEMEFLQQMVKRLRKQLPLFFPSLTGDREEFALHHMAIHRHNLIVDMKGNVRAVLDWECVSAMPLWKGCQIPLFMNMPEQSEGSDILSYSRDHIYLADLKQVERTRLRAHFLGEMAKLAPEWMVEYVNSKSKADFEMALSSCDSVDCSLWSWKSIKWLDRVEAGEKDLRLADV